jgi:ribonucleotide reductase alpha subunit
MRTLDELKYEGEAPYWLDEPGFKTLSSGYLLDNETPKGMYSRVSRAAASYYTNSSKWEKKFFEAMWNNWLCPASPVLSNLGTERGMPISCDSIHVGDSIDSIFMKNYELAVLSKNGAGVGIYFGDIRGRGTPIKGNGMSEGIVPWAKVMDTTIVSVNQGSVRRGSAAIYLPVDHLDISEFLNIRRPIGDINRRCLNINHAVCISDAWMQSMLDGDHDKRKLWENLLLVRVETGEPYIFFTDNVNKNNPECYVKNGLDVKTSNICCLSGDTLVLTDQGSQRIDSLVGKNVKVFDGKNWVYTDTFSQRGMTSLYRIHLVNGSFVDCTDDHRWFVASNYEQFYDHNYPWELQTKNLQVGQWLEYYDDTININHRTTFQVSQLPEYHIQTINIESADWNRITKIEVLEGEYPVYCPTIPTTGKLALANGLMTGNSEITLYTDPDHTFVCCLSSLNLVRWEEWKDTDVVNTMVRLLDAVLAEYIKKTENMKGMEASRRSAIKGRAIGIGVLGWHTLLQEKNLPFDSFDTMQLNAEIFRTIRAKAEEETAVMAKELGEPEWCKGFNRRHTHLIACAPTVSNSTISGGYSAGIEPFSANVFVQKSAKGTFIRKNATLERLLASKNQNSTDIWKSINEQNGSVQHLSFLDSHEKEVFLTAREINQHTIIKLAAQRQKWIDQAQSVNLFFAFNSSPKYIHEVHLAAWRSGLKTLYYCRSEGVIKSDLASRSSEECKSCEA